MRVGHTSDAAKGPIPRATPIIAAFLLALALLLATLARVTVRTDMAEFLPTGTGPARLILDEARSGTATGLILIGIEGAPQPELARLARVLAATLPATNLFQLVASGATSTAPDAEFLFAHRYAMGPATTPESFTEPALRASLEALLAQLRSSAAPLAVQYGLADPTGAFLALLRGWATATRVHQVDGAWFAPGDARALLLARTKAGGMDIPAQDAATAAIRAAFAAAQPGGARLLLSGPAIFAGDAARAIRGDVERISVISTLLVVALLWWRFRSPLVLLAIATPVVASVAAAAWTVQLLFGSVHGVALGFGATMLGVSVDYPVLMIGHRKRGEPAPATRARIGRAFRLAVACAVLGLLAMVFSPFPGLRQLGVFAAAGLIACAILTWTLLPRLVVTANLAPVESGSARWLSSLEPARRSRIWTALPVAAAALFLLVHGVSWQGDLQALSPVPAASLALDREMRAQLGTPDAGQIALVTGDSAETVLQRQEDLVPTLDRLRTDGALAGAELAARILPSARTQATRVDALPDAATLATRMDAARAGLPFRPDAFAPFLAAAAAARVAPPLQPADLDGTLLATRLAPLLYRRGDIWMGPVILSVRDPAAVSAALASTPAAYLDMRTELGRVLSDATANAWRWLAVSTALILLTLGAVLRSPGRVARVLLSVAAALLVTLALLAAAGVRISLIHLVAGQLVAGVGLDYALFFARPLRNEPPLDEEERARTGRTLLTCIAMTLLTFGLLWTCQTPLLRDIGETVAIGALAAMGFAFLLAGEAPNGPEGEQRLQ